MRVDLEQERVLLMNPMSGKACGGERLVAGDTDATGLVAA